MFFLVLAHPDHSGQRAVERVIVVVYFKNLTKYVKRHVSRLVIKARHVMVPVQISHELLCITDSRVH